MTIEQIIGKYDEAIMEAHADLMHDELNTAQIKALRESLELFLAGRDAIRDQRERENPRTLTLEELREMDGEPVWVELDDMGIWRIVEIVPNYNSTRLYSVYNAISAEHAIRDGNVYRYPPKEER